MASFKGRNKFLRALKSGKKRNLFGLSALSASLIFMNVFFLVFFLASWVSFLVTKYLGSKETGKRSKIPSITLPLGLYKIHLHHWLISSTIIAIALVKGSWLLPTEVFYGFLSGIVWQGVYCYDDWHKVVMPRRVKSSSATEAWLSPELTHKA